MNRHTLGPWKFYTEPQPNGCPIVGARGLMVAMLAHSINHDDQRETALANARLIAAAPDLLEALEWCAETLAVFVADGSAAPESVIGKNLTTARAAIAKATGEKE